MAFFRFATPKPLPLMTGLSEPRSPADFDSQPFQIFVIKNSFVVKGGMAGNRLQNLLTLCFSDLAIK